MIKIGDYVRDRRRKWNQVDVAWCYEGTVVEVWRAGSFSNSRWSSVLPGHIQYKARVQTEAQGFFVCDMKDLEVINDIKKLDLV